MRSHNETRSATKDIPYPTEWMIITIVRNWNKRYVYYSPNILSSHSLSSPFYWQYINKCYTKRSYLCWLEESNNQLNNGTKIQSVDFGIQFLSKKLEISDFSTSDVDTIHASLCSFWQVRFLDIQIYRVAGQLMISINFTCRERNYSKTQGYER